LGTGKGLLSPEQQSVRLDSFVSDVPPLNQPPLKGDLAYGIGLGKDHGWLGHNGEIPGYNTYLFYNPDLDAVVVVLVNSDISSGKCPKDVPIMKDCRGISPASYQRTESSKRSLRRWANPRHRRPSSSLEGQKAGPIGRQRIILGSHQTDLTALLLLGTFPPAGLSAQAPIHRSA
jgi:CubicO group peptidase (beta-lactamase class C family)